MTCPICHGNARHLPCSHYYWHCDDCGAVYDDHDGWVATCGGCCKFGPVERVHEQNFCATCADEVLVIQDRRMTAGVQK